MGKGLNATDMGIARWDQTCLSDFPERGKRAFEAVEERNKSLSHSLNSRIEGFPSLRSRFY